MKKLILFVDGYPWGDVHHLQNLNFIKNSFPMRPSFGYSVNLHHELFAGKSPDNLCFFGDANRKDSSFSSPHLIIRLLDWFRFKYPFIVRVIYKILSRILRKPLAFIPPSLLKKFEFTGRYLFHTNDCLSFGNSSFKVVCYDKKIKFGKRDLSVFNETLNLIDDGYSNIISTFTELDWVFHISGYRTKRYNKKIDLLTTYLNKIGNYYLSKNPEGEVVIVSDHGMADTKQSVNFQLEKKFGMPFTNGISYFYDSLYLLLWNDGNDELYRDIIIWLKSQKCGSFINESDRKKFNISSHKFGNDIFLLEEGFGFAPNYFGYRPLKAYHGYAPNFESMKVCTALLN